MESGILPPELKSIEQLFTADTRYAVPLYQRSFAWSLDEIEELWEDLEAAVNRGGDYFLGTIVLHKKKSGPQEIIDGQQRLACISMIFSAIRNFFEASHDQRSGQIFIAFLGAKDFTRDSVATPKLVLNQINNEVFVQYIIASANLDNVDRVLKSKDLHESNKLLLQAYKFFLEKVIAQASARGTQSDDFVVPLVNCLRTSVKLITIPVTSEEDANLFFESLNARGKELAVSDLVKNRLYSESADQVARAQQLWERMENGLARRPIPEFLRHFWIAKKADPKNLNVREKQLYRMVSQNVKGKKADTLRLLADLELSAGDYAKISDYSLWPDDDAYDDLFEESLSTLRLFRVTQCNPLLLNAIQQFKSPRDIARVFRIVVNFSFRYFIIGNQSPGNLERISTGIAYEIREGTYSSPQGVADALRAVSSDANFRADFTLAKMKSSARLARYTLTKISNHMSRQSTRTGSEQIVNPDAKQVNLEHVLPIGFSQNWHSTFSRGADPADYLYRIGNLTLLTAKINRDAADASFAEKQRLALSDSTLAINGFFRNVQKWGEQEIEQRQGELAKVALEVWKL